MASSTRGSLNARLTLEGKDDVKRQVNDLADSAERDFRRINKAATSGEGFEHLEEGAEHLRHSFEGLSNLGSISGLAGLFDTIAGSVGRFNVVLGASLAVITGATAGLYELAESGAKFASEIKDGATRVGTSAENYASLRFAFEQSAASADDFEKAMGKILEASGDAQDGANNVENAADKIVHSEDRIKAAAEAMQEAWRKRGDTLREGAIRAADDLSEIQLRYDRQRIANQDLTADKLAAADKKNNDDRAEAIRLLNKRLAEEKRLADKAYAEAQAEQTRQNMKQAQKDLDAYYKAINDSASKQLSGSNKAIAALGVTIKETADKVRDPVEIYLDIADKIGEIEDPATKSAKAIEIFGRRMGTKLVESLSEGRGAIRALMQEAKDLNIVPTATELDIGKKFDDEIAKLQSVIRAASGRVGLAFAPLFGNVVDALASTIGHAIPAMIQGAMRVAEILKPIFDDVANVILGNTDKIKIQFIQVLVQAAQAFARAVGIAIEVVTPVVQGLIAAFNYLDEAIQETFGGLSIGGIAGYVVAWRTFLGVISLVDIAISALITGPLAMLATALAPILTAMTAVAAAVGWPVILLAGLVALGVGLLAFTDAWNNYKISVLAYWALLRAFGEWLARGFTAAFDAAANYVKSSFDRMVYWGQYAIGLLGQAWDWLYEKIKIVADAIASVFGASSSVTSNPSSGGIPTNAEGGPITGPGTGTSDSILSWLSNGEFVVKARAVRYWGLSAMRDLNNMISPRGFAAGGYVDALGGSMAASSRGAAAAGLYQAAAATEGRVSVDLTHNGNTFYGLLAPARLAAQLESYANGQQRVSLGRRSTAFGLSQAMA